jgi:hypothetical protein
LVAIASQFHEENCAPKKSEEAPEITNSLNKNDKAHKDINNCEGEAGIMSKCMRWKVSMLLTLVAAMFLISSCQSDNHKSQLSQTTQKSDEAHKIPQDKFSKFAVDSTFDSNSILIASSYKELPKFETQSTFNTNSISLEELICDTIKTIIFPNYDPSQITVEFKKWPYKINSYLGIFTISDIQGDESANYEPGCSSYKFAVFEYINQTQIHKIAESELLTLRPAGMQGEFDWYDKSDGLGDDDKQLLKFETKCPYIDLTAFTYKIAENVPTFCINSELFDSYPGGDDFEASSSFLFAQIKDSIYCVLEYLMDSKVLKRAKEFSEEGFSFRDDLSLSCETRLELLDHKTNGFFDFRIRKYNYDMLQIVRDSVDISKIKPDVDDTLKWDKYSMSY